MRLSQICELLSPGFSPIAEHDGWLVRCPSHDDTHASLRVAVSAERRLLVKCRAGCETSAVVAASQAESLASLEPVEVDLSDQVRAVNDTAPPSIERQVELVTYLEDAHERLSQEAIDYAAQRFRLTEDQLSWLGVGWDDGTEPWDLLSAAYRDAHRLVVPFRDFDGIPRGFQARAIGESRTRWAGPLNPDGASWSRYAFFRAQTGYDYVLVTEGPGDALAAVSAGFDSVGIRGAAMAGSVIPLIAEHCEGRPIVVCGDNDDAGTKFNSRLTVGLHELGLDVFELSIPGEYGDLADWCEKDDGFVENLQQAVASARQFTRAHQVDIELTDSSDLAIAKMIVESLDGTLLHTPGQGFMYWNGLHWARDETERVRIICREFLEVLYHAQDGELTEAENGVANVIIGKIVNRRTFDDILKEVQALVGVSDADFDAQEHLLSVRNGTIDLRTGELGPHRREYMLTHSLKVPYNADASCDRWLQFLSEIFPEQPDMLPYIQQLIGYGITGSTSEQCFVILWGRGANGKSVFTDALTHVFRDISRITPFSTFEVKRGGGIPNDVAALNGARLVHASEGEVHAHLSEATLKRLTGQDRIAARFMRQEFFEFEPHFLIIMATNHKPSFMGQDEGLWRRVRLVPFLREFKPEERDRDLSAKLKDEAEGILAWAVRGAVQWYASGRLEVPVRMQNENEAYRTLSDRLYGFLEQYEQDPDSSLPVKEVWQDYLKWVDDEGIPMKEVWGRRVFEASMEERGFVMRPVPRQGRIFIGIRRKQ